MRMLAWLAAGALSATCASADERPRAGTSLDETRRVELMTVVPEACLAVEFGDVVVLLDRADVERLAEGQQEDGGDGYRGMRDLSAHQRRARRLLEHVQDDPDRNGCMRVASNRSADQDHLVLHFLESGSAAVFSFDGAEPEPAVLIRYHGKSSGPLSRGGRITVRTLHGTADFLSIAWWRSLR